MKSQHAPQFLTVSEVARQFKVSGRAVRYWIAEGKLTAYLMGQTYLITLESVEALKEKRRRQSGQYPTGDA